MFGPKPDGPMQAWYVVGFEGHWPVGTAAIAVAPTEDEARRLISWKLIENGLKPLQIDAAVQPLPLDQPNVIILLDGNY